MIGVRMHFVGDDFFFRSSDETQLAMSQIAFRSQGWTEGATDYGAGFVKLASALLGIENGAGHIVGIVVPLFAGFVGVVIVQQSGSRIAGKFWRKPSHCCRHSFADAGGSLRVLLFELCQSLSQADRVELIDGK